MDKACDGCCTSMFHPLQLPTAPASKSPSTMLKTLSLGGGVATPPLPSTSPSGTEYNYLLRSLPLLSSRVRTPPQFHRLPLLRHSRRKRRHCRVDALDGCATGTSGFPPKPISVKIPVGDRHILVETGHIGRQASASVTVTDGETIIYSSVCLADTPSEPSDFFPLSVHYQERLSAVGRTSGGFFKREGRTKDHEVLICRLIDRPLRPTMPKCFYHETQLLSWVFSYDGMHSPDCLAVTAAGIAVALSEVPNTKIVAGVRVGLVDNRFIVNPTNEEMEKSELDLLLAGTDDATLMIEGYCNFLSEEHLLEAVKVGQEAVRSICKAVEELTEKCGKPKMTDAIKLPPAELYQHVEEIAGDQIEKALQISGKISRRKALSLIEDKVLSILSEEGYIWQDRISGNSEGVGDAEDEDEDEIVVDGEVDEGDVHITPASRKCTPLIFSDVDVKLVYKEVTAKFWRKQIVQGKKRSDGRAPQDIRPISAQCGILPRTHGSAVFTRGETQSLAVVTLGDKQMAQRVDNLMGTEEFKRFYLQYSFPPSCVGEVGRIGAPNRREIGHGMLAERALEAVLPSEDDFPYTIRVESTITESNGSSSMASVCGGTLALLDAGVPLKYPIAGVAMGLILDTKEFGGDGNPLILSDITGAEDAAGDMDLKVAGNEDGITAFQMDIKVLGITLPVIEKALLQARDGKRHVLSEMSKSSPPPAMQVSKYAPLIHIIKVRRDKVNAIIGAGGKKIRSIIEETGVEAIETDDDGIVKITAKSSVSIEKSKAIIASLTMVPTIGDIYRNCEVKSIASYGVFVEIAPGREALCHISELSSNWLAKAEEVIKIGDRIDVKLIEINEKGQLRLSRKALLVNDDPEKVTTQQKTHDSSGVTMVERPLANGAVTDNSITETPRLKEEIGSSSEVTSRTENPKKNLPREGDVKKVVAPTIRADKWKRSVSKTIAKTSSKDAPSTANETKAG